MYQRYIRIANTSACLKYKRQRVQSEVNSYFPACLSAHTRTQLTLSLTLSLSDTQHEVSNGVSDPFIEVLVDNKLYAETTIQEKTVNPGVPGANEA
jgi:hypothetical protein